MRKINYRLFLLLAIFQSSFSQRRIKDGKEVQSDKKYMVYLLSAPLAPVEYHGWLCGGVIISKDYVLTSAACVQDVQHMYVISGYRKYVSKEKIDKDECLKTKRKKVVLTCVPKSYEFDYNKTELWARIDIALVKVDTSFDFTDATYETVCSYIPRPIDFNTEKDFPRPGDDVMALGWGHTKMFRKETDTRDLNQEMLQYAPTKVLDEDKCLSHFPGNKELAEFITSSMICTLERGNLNDKGELILRQMPTVTGCITEKDKLNGVIGKMCDYDNVSEFYASQTVGELTYDIGNAGETAMYSNRRQIVDEDTGGEIVELEEVIIEDPTTAHIESSDELGNEDTPGICQNDHGGPLISWRGGQELVVGVATLYKLNSNHYCRGPYLFTKTWCNSAFLHCIIDGQNKTSSSRRCDNPAEIGFEVIRRHISWVGHRDGPAANERIQTRHQVPMSAFRPLRNG